MISSCELNKSPRASNNAGTSLNPVHWVSSNPSCLRSSSFELAGGQLRVLQRKPFHPLLAEVDLQARIGAGSFRVDDDALAEFRVQHRLADAEPVAGGFGFVALCRHGRPGRVVEFGVPQPRRKSLNDFLRGLVAEAL